MVGPQVAVSICQAAGFVNDLPMRVRSPWTPVMMREAETALSSREGES